MDELGVEGAFGFPKDDGGERGGGQDHGETALSGICETWSLLCFCRLRLSGSGPAVDFASVFALRIVFLGAILAAERIPALRPTHKVKAVPSRSEATYVLHDLAIRSVVHRQVSPSVHLFSLSEPRWL